MSLIDDISAELSISRGSEESLLSWESRVVYSAVGHIASASLYDVQEDRAAISIQHFRRKVDDLRASWLSILPELKLSAGLSEEMYTIMLNAGCMYHSPNRITPPAFSSAAICGVEFLRGAPPGMRVLRSGLGAYRLSEGRDSASSLASMFGLRRMAGNDEYRSILHSKFPPSIFHVDGDVVLLRLQCLYPPAEMNMLRLYSWPESLFRYTLPRPVFMAIKHELEGTGWTFREE